MKNDYITDGDITRIKINCKGDVLEAIVDTADLVLLNKYEGTWYGFKRWDKAYVQIYQDKKICYLHRVLMCPQKSEFVDHINNNPLDNRKCNLRIVTCAQNNMNRKLNKNSTSGYKGVCWNKEINKWYCYINHNSKRISLGFFEDKHVAAEVYNQNAVKLHGEYAQLNNITEVSSDVKC